MSLDRLAETIGRVLDQLAAARSALAHASQATVEVRDMYAQALEGAHDADAAQVPGVATEAVEQVDQQHGRLAQIEPLLRGYLDRLGATTAPASRQQPAPVAPSAPAGDPAPPPAPAGVSAPDGSRYPHAAAWAADMLPSRVVPRTQQRTVGLIDGVPGQFTSGVDDTWSGAVQQRLRDLGLRPQSARFMQAHVELKVAEYMLTTRQRHTELVINNEPCRARDALRPGCRELLPRYLPRG
ncbi:SCP1.201-like deaminase [Prauserella halophila]|uniref:SCP1.201-like deaminase n=1 Tax=Prauserella halophila TaxID=185641 RepID=A0ABN1W842_9PSEU|nr:DddA-like double-stranded DNA deaminase toxin [Prauserella halophila]MCP2234957.1 SCP1.201-like deaminase [Prauserella halophila]